MTFGEVVRMYRKRKSLQLQELARRIGVSPQYLGDIERGHRNPPTGDTLALLAHNIEVSPMYLTIMAGRLPEIPVHADDPKRVEAGWRAFLRALVRPARHLPNDERVSTRILLTWEHLIEQAHAIQEAARILDHKGLRAEAAEAIIARDYLVRCARSIHHSRIRLGKMADYRAYVEECIH